jgi:SAM-dependent methyltransferase
VSTTLRKLRGRARFIKRAIWYCRGQYDRECPICGYEGRFLPYSWPPRIDAMCPSCESVERHRLMALALKARPDLLKAGDDVLHFAPETWLRPHLATYNLGSYRTADIRAEKADEVLNIEAIDFPDASVDVAIASHVLEHVDDSKALPELFRILKPGGRFLCMVPLIEGWDETFDDPDIDTMKERKRHYEGKRHLRYFGRDLRDRMMAVGFEPEEYTGIGKDVVRYSLLRGEKLFIGRKPGG